MGALLNWCSSDHYMDKQPIWKGYRGIKMSVANRADIFGVRYGVHRRILQ